MFKEDGSYVLSLDLEDVTICIKAENDLQVQDKYSNVFVFKTNNLRILPLGANNLQVWGISGHKSVELQVTFPDFPFYKPASKGNDTMANNVHFSASKISFLKEFITGLFTEPSQEYCWMSALDGNRMSVDFGDQVVVSANDPVMLSRFLKKLLDWASIPIVVSSMTLDKESFRRSLRFWVEELIKKRSSPIAIELLEIRADEGGDIDYFDQEFLDELQDVSQGESSVFTRGFIQCKIEQVVHEYYRSSGASHQNIDKTVELVKEMKNPDAELIDSIVFNNADSSYDRAPNDR